MIKTQVQSVVEKIHGINNPEYRQVDPKMPKAIEMNDSPPQTLTEKMVGEKSGSGVSTSDINLLKMLMPGAA